MKKYIAAIGIFLFFLFAMVVLGVVSASASQMQIYVNGKEVHPAARPQVINQHVFIPVSFVKDQMGMRVAWDGKLRCVTIRNNNKKIVLTVNSKIAKVDGTAKKLDEAPVMLQGRTYLPFRIVGELTGTEAGWLKETDSLVFNSPVHIVIKGTPVTAKVYRTNKGYFVTAKDIAAATGYKMKQKSASLLFIKGTDVRTLHPVNGKGGFATVDNQWVIPLAFVDELVKGSGSWNADKSIYRVDKPNLNSRSISPSGPNKPAPSNMIKPVVHNPSTSQDSILTETNDEPAPSPLLPAVPLSGKEKVTIVVDAGHGGKDTGAIGVNDTREKDFTLAVVLKLADDLKKEPKFNVILTRDGDTYPTLTDRVKIANDAPADLFISVHANSGPPSANGTETYYYADQSKGYADTVHAHLVQVTGFTDRKVKTADFYVIKNTKMPSILVEVGFITNADNNREMMDDSFQQKVADGIYQGIVEYCQDN
ncbi:N-acetylmuramoyl-L-alanine amidase [Aneurinibacillus terranovensis]|uniref:N-acetylmuramoyl-L-alanine amidase n=1 Tax=Aneurinibacillus terranovensis TaxID=278991 RepID=UPI0004195D58|nr:N-acetylmuramoyl-L-alanine amidase [Aneurinibacillus terranovensis]